MRALSTLRRLSRRGVVSAFVQRVDGESRRAIYSFGRFFGPSDRSAS